MEQNYNHYNYPPRPEIPLARFLRYLLIGILLGCGLVFIVEYLWFGQVYAYYEVSRILCWLDTSDDLDKWRMFWPYIDGLGNVSPYDIVKYIEKNSGFQIWFCLRLFLCHVVSIIGVFWCGYRLSTRAMINKAFAMGDRGTAVVSAEELDKSLKRRD